MSTLSATNLKNASSSSNNIVLGTDGSVTVGTITGTSVRGVVTSGTSVASTSGTSIDFTSIPSWVKRITVMLQGVSLSGTSLFLVQLGTSGGLQTSGYVSGTGDRAGETTSTAGFVLIRTGVAANTYSATVPICLYSTNAWITSGVINRVTDGFANQFAGAVTLSGTLDRIRITTANGTDTFDAGNINILYEG